MGPPVSDGAQAWLCLLRLEKGRHCGQLRAKSGCPEVEGGSFFPEGVKAEIVYLGGFLEVLTVESSSEGLAGVSKKRWRRKGYPRPRQQNKAQPGLQYGRRSCESGEVCRGEIAGAGFKALF